jgi:hypothetical protein
MGTRIAYSANETRVGASSYQTNPHPARYSGLRTERATLEKLSIVRTLPYAPDLCIRNAAMGGVGYFSRWYDGKAC